MCSLWSHHNSLISEPVLFTVIIVKVEEWKLHIERRGITVAGTFVTQMMWWRRVFLLGFISSFLLCFLHLTSCWWLLVPWLLLLGCHQYISRVDEWKWDTGASPEWGNSHRKCLSLVCMLTLLWCQSSFGHQRDLHVISTESLAGLKEGTSLHNGFLANYKHPHLTRSWKHISVQWWGEKVMNYLSYYCIIQCMLQAWLYIQEPKVISGPVQHIWTSGTSNCIFAGLILKGPTE